MAAQHKFINKGGNHKSFAYILAQYGKALRVWMITLWVYLNVKNTNKFILIEKTMQEHNEYTHFNGRKIKKQISAGMMPSGP